MKTRGFTILALARHETPHDNLADMDSWRRVDVPVLPGSGPAPRVYDTASGDLVLARQARWPRCTPAASPPTTRRTSGTLPLTPPGTCWSGPGWTRCPRPDPGVRSAAARPVHRDLRPERHRRRRPAAGTGRPRRRGLARAGPPRDPALPLRHGGAAHPAAHPPGRGGGGVPVIERFNVRMANRGALYDLDQDLYFAKSADPEFGALSGPGTPSGYDPAEMAELSAQRGGDPASQGRRTRWTLWSGAPNGPASQPGSRGSAAVGPAGTSSAPRSPPSTWAPSSTCRRAVRTWCSRTTS